MERPLITVIVLVYNAGDYLPLPGEHLPPDDDRL